MKIDFTRTAVYVPPLLARLAFAALSLCMCVRVRQTSMWLIALLVSGWLIFQSCCLRPVALLLARCRCVSPCCLLIFCFPKYGPICLCCLPPPHPYTGPERMGGLGRIGEEVVRGRKRKLSVIDRQSQCLWRLENHQGDGEWFSFGFLSCLVVLITLCVIVLECVWMCASECLGESDREKELMCLCVMLWI